MSRGGCSREIQRKTSSAATGRLIFIQTSVLRAETSNIFIISIFLKSQKQPILGLTKDLGEIGALGRFGILYILSTKTT